jgi:hypothetical protein
MFEDFDSRTAARLFSFAASPVPVLGFYGRCRAASAKAWNFGKT